MHDIKTLPTSIWICLSFTAIKYLGAKPSPSTLFGIAKMLLRKEIRQKVYVKLLLKKCLWVQGACILPPNPKIIQGTWAMLFMHLYSNALKPSSNRKFLNRNLFGREYFRHTPWHIWDFPREDSAQIMKHALKPTKHHIFTTAFETYKIMHLGGGADRVDRGIFSPSFTIPGPGNNH